jgi:ABC-type transport system substrate-binding protein
MSGDFQLNRRLFNSGLVGAAMAGVSMPLLNKQGWAAAPELLRVAYGSLGANRHPHSISNLPDTDIANVIFDPLVTRNADGSIQPVLAEKVEPLGGDRWRFTLREGAKFHDGRPVTAKDVKFSLENFLNPATTNGYLYLGWLDKVDIVNDRIVEVVSKRPYRVALANMAYLSHIIPSDATDAKAFAQKLIGSGPYRFVEFVPNDRVVVEANQQYWGSKPKFKRIVFRQIAENSTRVAAVEAGEVDFASAVPVDDIATLRRAKLRVHITTTARTMFMRFNLLADSPIRDIRVRQALNHAVNRDALRKALLAEVGSDATSPVATGIKYRAADLPPYDFNLTKARALLAAAGHANGFQVKIATPNGRYLKDKEMAEAVAGQLEQVGVRAQIVPLEWATYLQQVRAEKDTTGRQYPISLMAWGNLIGDPDFSMVPFDSRSTAWNLGGYANDEVQSLIEKGRSTFDEKELGEIYAKAQQIIWRDAPWLFLFDLPSVDALSPMLEGYESRADEQIRWNQVSLGTN